MENEQSEQARTNKVKLITWCVVIAAVALVYIFVVSKDGSGTAATSDNNAAATNTGSQTSISTSDNTATPSPSAAYKDGTYSASATYRTPEGSEEVDVSLTLQDGAITSATVQQTPNDPKATRYQAAFAENYKPLVIGKKIDDVQLSRVSGSSLTSIGFNAALKDIQAQAQTDSQS